MKFLHVFTYFLCINSTVKVKKKRVYSVFTTFKMKLFLIKVNGLRHSLKIWQVCSIDFNFFLSFTTSWVSQFIFFYFEKIFNDKPYRYLWIFYRRAFWICWRKNSRTFQNTTIFKEYAKKYYLIIESSLYFQAFSRKNIYFWNFIES